MSTAEHLSKLSSPHAGISRLRDASRDADEFDFLAPERRQKYDLLVHLLANLRQPLFLSGPDGIGKSAFLQCLHDHPLAGWRICLIEASPQLSLEQVQQALTHTLGVKIPTDSPVGSERALRGHLETLAQHDGYSVTVILALDDAGSTLPGLLDALCRFVSEYPVLRLVAALRPDDLHVKAVTDPRAVEEAHVIELPPLTESQCGVYLGLLWTRLGQTGEPHETLVREVYQRSHGIPARIRQETVNRIGSPPLRWHRSLAVPVYLALGIVAILVLGVTYWQQTGSQTPKVAMEPKSSSAGTGSEASGRRSTVQIPSLELKAGRVGDIQATLPPSELPGAVPETAWDPALDLIEVPPETEFPQESERTAPAADAAPMVELPGRAARNTMERKTELAASGVHTQDWLLQQDPMHFTLQIAAFDKPGDLLGFVKHHPELRPLSFYAKVRNGRAWYPLLYGVFPTLSEAQRAMQGLPPGSDKPWLRRLRSVQKDIRTAQSD